MLDDKKLTFFASVLAGLVLDFELCLLVAWLFTKRAGVSQIDGQNIPMDIKSSESS